jgi:flagellar hook-associated protein 3 FlgL
MRISSQQMFDAGVKSIQDHAGDTMKYQTQISSGKKYQNVSDSPADIGLGMKYAFDKAQFEMFQNNQKLMIDRTNVIEAQLGSIYTAMSSLKQVVAQSNGASGQSDLSALGQKAASLRDLIIQLTDAKDSSGRPILKPLPVGTDSVGNVEIEPNVFIPEGISLSESMGRYNSSAGAPVGGAYVDVIAIANSVVSALTGTPPTVPSTEVAANLDIAVTQVRAAQVKSGLLSKQIEGSQDAVETKMGNLENARAVMLDTDIAEASANLSRSQTLLQAAQNIFSKLQTSSLFDKL